MTPRVMPLNVCTLAILLSLYLCGVHSALTHDPTRHCAAACARHLHNVVAHLHTQLQLLLLRVLLCHCSLRPTRSFLLNQSLCQVAPPLLAALACLHFTRNTRSFVYSNSVWLLVCKKERSGAKMGGNERLAGGC